MANYKYLTYEDRTKIEELLKEKYSVTNIAEMVDCSRKTIYEEIRRGISKEEYKNKEFEKYKADLAQAKITKRFYI